MTSLPRRRRPRRVGALVALALLAVVGGSVGVAALVRSHSPSGTAAGSHAAPNRVAVFPRTPSAPSIPVATPWAKPALVAYMVPVSVAFPDVTDGWAVGDACDLERRCEIGAARTTDSGATWALASPPVDPRASSYGLRVIAASATDAWVWGTDSSGVSAFTATHDGGRSWHSADVGGTDVVDVVLAGATVWAETGCPPRATPCSGRVLSSPVGGGSWTDLGALPTAVEGPAFTDSGIPGPQLVRSGTRAWVVNANQQQAALLRSDYGGRSWISLADPCAAHASIVLAASSDQHVMLACANTGGWPAPQETWSSTDGGAHWTLSSRDGYASWTPPRPNVGRIGSGGAPIGLVVVSATTAWMANDREDDLVTHDDGVTWAHAALPPGVFGGGGGAEGVTFADALHGWTFSSAGLWATRDGGARWEYQPIIGRVPGF